MPIGDGERTFRVDEEAWVDQITFDRLYHMSHWRMSFGMDPWIVLLERDGEPS